MINPTTDTHRQLPQSPDAEKGYLGSVLLNPNVLDEHPITPDQLHIPAHSLILRTIIILREARKPTDFITLTQKLKDDGYLDQAGGPAFISELFCHIPTAANAAYYAEIICEKHTLRQIITIGTEYVGRGYTEQENVTGLLDTFESEVLAIGQNRNQDTETRTMSQHTIDAVDHIERMYERKGAIGGLATGYGELDEMTDGMHGGEMIVIAARPSRGKTALAMNIAENVCESGKRVGVFSLEMSVEQLTQRLLYSMARVNSHQARKGFLSAADFPKITVAANRMSKLDMRINDKSGINHRYITTVARRWHRDRPLDLLVIDYLQMLRGTGKNEDEITIVSENSGAIKTLAKELGIPVIVLAQLNRNPENRTGGSRGKPRLSDLRSSGQIEQDADVVGLLSRPELDTDSEEEKQELEGQAVLEIAKSRNGPIGDVKLTFIRQYTRFEERAREESQNRNYHRE